MYFDTWIGYLVKPGKFFYSRQSDTYVEPKCFISSWLSCISNKTIKKSSWEDLASFSQRKWEHLQSGCISHVVRLNIPYVIAENKYCGVTVVMLWFSKRNHPLLVLTERVWDIACKQHNLKMYTWFPYLNALFFSFVRWEAVQMRVWWLWQEIREQQWQEEALSRPHER